MRFVSSPDNPVSRAEHLRREYAEMEAGREAKVRQLLQRAYFVAVQFRQLLGDFERFQAHPFWKQTWHKPRDHVDIEVGPPLHPAGDHDALVPSRQQVRRDP